MMLKNITWNILILYNLVIFDKHVLKSSGDNFSFLTSFVLYIIYIYIIRCIIIHNCIPSYGFYYYQNKILFLCFDKLLFILLSILLDLFLLVHKILKLLHPSDKCLLFHFIYVSLLYDIFQLTSLGNSCLSNVDFYTFVPTRISNMFGFISN